MNEMCCIMQSGKYARSSSKYTEHVSRNDIQLPLSEFYVSVESTDKRNPNTNLIGRSDKSSRLIKLMFTGMILIPIRQNTCGREQIKHNL